MLSKWLVGQGWNSVFYGNIFVLRHSFFRTFWLKFLWTQISDGDACWRKWWYVQFFRAVLFQFRKFRAILIKMKRLQLVTDREVGLGWKQRGSWITGTYFCKQIFWKSTFTTLISISTGIEKKKGLRAKLAKITNFHKI
mgnify:CR=1 FL=1